MADSLVLKGVKDVRRQTGTEMLRLNPPRGGDTFQLSRWWTPGSKGTIYVDCTLFKVTASAGDVHLAIDSNMGTDLTIVHDGDANFIFRGINEVSRAALFDANMDLIEHYVFASIAGGPTMTVIPPGAAPKPAGGNVPTAIGNVTIDGGDEIINTNVESHLINASISGNATVTWQWTLANGPGGLVFSNATAASTTITGDAAGTYQVTATASSNDANLIGANSKSMNYAIEVVD